MILRRSFISSPFAEAGSGPYAIPSMKSVPIRHLFALHRLSTLRLFYHARHPDAVIPSCKFVRQVDLRGANNASCGDIVSMARSLENLLNSQREGGPTVDLHLAVRDDGLDHALLLEVVEALAGQRAVDLHAVDESGDGDEAVGLDILVELLRGGLVEDDGVLGLVLDLALGPLLLLLLSSSCGRL